MELGNTLRKDRFEVFLLCFCGNLKGEGEKKKKKKKKKKVTRKQQRKTLTLTLAILNMFTFRSRESIYDYSNYQ